MTDHDGSINKYKLPNLGWPAYRMLDLKQQSTEKLLNRLWFAELTWKIDSKWDNFAENNWFMIVNSYGSYGSYPRSLLLTSPKNGTNRMFISKYGNIWKMTRPKKQTTAFMVSKFHRKDEITKQFYRKITSCRQKRKTYPLVFCCITIENKPFSLLIYLFKMVILYSKLWVYHRVNTNLVGGFDLFSIRRSGSSCFIPGKLEQFGTTRNPLFQSALSTDKVPHGTPKSGYIWLIFIFSPKTVKTFVSFRFSRCPRACESKGKLF